MSARLCSVECFIAAYPVVGDFRYLAPKDGKRITRNTVVVRLRDDTGAVGWGQSVPSPTWSYETIETVQTTLEHHLAPAIIGLPVDDTAAIWAAMNRVIAPAFSTGQPIAKAGIDLALFDLQGRRAGLTPSQRWGAASGAPVTLSWTIDVGSAAEVEAAVAQASAKGFSNFNVKIGRDAATDVAICRQLRLLAPSAFIWADANGGYDEAAALNVARGLADAGLAAFEQPLPANRLPGYRTLRRLGALPILMDEGVVSLADLESFHQLELLDGVAMKVSRVGGLTEAVRMVEYLRNHGLHFFASGLTDPDVAFAACLHLFSAFRLPPPAALNAPQFLSGSILAEPLRIDGDQAFPPSGAGLGVHVARRDPATESA
jgi:muconate cycloisomerase